MQKTFKALIIFSFVVLVFSATQISAQCTDPVNPLDGAIGSSTPVTLDWCSVSESHSYQLRIFEVSLDAGGNEIETPFSLDIVPLSQACIKNFSQNTTYRWQTTGCTGDDGSGCSSFGPKWQLTTDGPALISPPALSTPADGATVSLPVDFDWTDIAGAKSYYYEIYKATELVDSGDTTDSEKSVGLAPLTKNTTYTWKIASCLDNNGKRCGVNCCSTEPGSECADFSLSRSFTTDNSATLDTPQLSKPYYDPAQPGNIPSVNSSNFLIWQIVAGAEFYYYEILDSGTPIISQMTSSTVVRLSTILNQLNEGVVYDWHVKSCWGDQIGECEATWSETWKFEPVGQIPSVQYPTDGTSNVTIPISFDWTDIPGARSYQYEISSSSDTLSGTVSVSNIELDHTKLNLSTNYSWRVRACFDKDNTICSDWSSSHSFSTITLNPPTSPNPSNGGDLFTYERTISWSPALGANFYRYRIDYASPSGEEDNRDCTLGSNVVPETIVSSNSANIDLKGWIGTYCLGTYNWRVESCVDVTCNEGTGLTNSPLWTFNLIQPTPPAQSGLVPCGKDYDIDTTPWSEDENCSFKHIFIIMRNIVDFILWRLSLAALVILIIITALTYYFSLGDSSTIIRVKSLWSAAGKALLFMLLAWMIMNIILAALGYRISIFGSWWVIDFNN